MKAARAALFGFRHVLAIVHRGLFALRFWFRSRQWRADDREMAAGARKVVVSGFFNEVFGIAQAGRLTAAALKKGGWTVDCDDLRRYEAGLLRKSPHVFETDAGVWMVHANPPEARIALYTHDYAGWRDLYRIGYWVWESDLAPAAWVPVAKWFHEIWVPSAFAEDAFRAAFIRAGHPEYAGKLRLRPHPVEAGPAPGPGDAPDGAVTAMVVFDPRSGLDRKNPLAAVRAWIAAFPEASGAAHLIVKSLPDAGVSQAAAELQVLCAGRPDITQIREAMSEAEFGRLAGRCGLLISLHRAEGFGLSLAEAMARGQCVVATGWSGNLTFMTRENSALISCRLVPASPAYNGPRAQWAEPDIAEAADQLVRLVADAPARAAMSARARQDISRLSEAWLKGFRLDGRR